MRGADVTLECRCDADVDGCDGCCVAEDDDGATARWSAEEEAVIREQEEEAASRGWAWRPPEQVISLGSSSPAVPTEAKLLSLPEAAAQACATPGRSFVLGQSGAVYSARWHGRNACHGPSASPWSRWSPPSPSLKVVEISALSAHVLLRTAAATALSFGEPMEGKLGYHEPRAVYVSAPRMIEGLRSHTIVGVAAGGRHSLFLTDKGECYTAGANHAFQCGSLAPGEAPRPIRGPMLVPEAGAKLVQVSAGHAHTLLLSHSGRVYACGLNDRGQCGIEPPDDSDEMVVARPTLVSGLVPHIVRAVEAAPSLSAFEVEEVAVSAPADDEEVKFEHETLGTAPPPVTNDHSYRVWLAGHVEAFNIPGTNAHVGGLRFLPSCYRWQLLAASAS